MNRKKIAALFLLSGLLTLTSCGGGKSSNDYLDDYEKVVDYERDITDDKYRSFYEIFVGSFYDGNNDRKGDLRGIIQKLDYLEYLGVSGIWMMPINPSRSYHKYDVDDYYGVDDSYGTVEDFVELTSKAKEKDISIILDLVLNHSSSKHEWFTSAVETLRTPVCAGSVDLRPTEACIAENPYVDYYNFYYNKPSTGVYYSSGAGNWYYEGWFSSDMPDLNLNNEGLKAEIVDIMRFWIGKGAAGFRLDAAKHYFLGQTENVAFLNWLNGEAKKIKEDVYFVGEVFNSVEEKEYYASGLDSFFNFNFGTSNGIIKTSINIGDAHSFAYNSVAYYNYIKKKSAGAIAANFLGNHDMPRSANAYAGDYKEQQIKMSLAMTQTLTGTSFMYYGEEIGMISLTTSDPNFRTAMLWSDYPDENGFCSNAGNGTTREQKYPTLETQMADPTSIFNFSRKALALRNKYPWMARGVPEEILVDKTDKVSIIKKTYEGKTHYIVYCLDTIPATINLDVASEVLDTLATNGLRSKLNDNKLTVQPYSITILQ